MSYLKTKAQRHKFYKHLLEKVCNDPTTFYGLCYYISTMGVYAYDSKYFRQYLPELWNLGPAKKHKESVYWFPNTPKGWQKRIALIEKCIELTKPKTSKL